MFLVEFDPRPLNDFLAYFSPQGLDKARMRAVNYAAARGKTEGSKRIRQVWELKAGILRPRIKVIKTNSGSKPATIRAQSRPLSLSLFYVEEEYGFGASNKLERRGVTYRIFKKGPEKHLPHDFLATTRSGHVGVFSRMDAPRPARRRSAKSPMVRPRLRIRDRKVVSIPEMFKKKEVYPFVERKVQESLEKEFWRQLTL